MTIEELQRQIDACRDLLASQDDDETYIARGNGFCDTKYSTAFLEARIAQLEVQLKDMCEAHVQ